MTSAQAPLHDELWLSMTTCKIWCYGRS